MGIFLMGIFLVTGLGRTEGLLPLSADDGEAPVLIRDASLVLTMDPHIGQGPLGLIEDGDVLLNADRIVAVGNDLHVADDDDNRVVEAHGKIVMPGFVDLHNHLWQSLIRGCVTDSELNGWLVACVFPLSQSAVSTLTPTPGCGCPPWT